MAGRGGVTRENVHDVVSWHEKPTEAQLDGLARLSKATEVYILVLLDVAPECADRTAAIRKVREAKWTAACAIALDGAI